MNKPLPKQQKRGVKSWGSIFIFLLVLFAALVCWGAIKPLEKVEVEKEYNF